MTIRAFIDTTVFADALLKPDERGRRAKRALAHFRESHIPVYALKEFRYGPLSKFIWFHNTLVETNSVPETVEKLGRFGRQPNFMSTALEAFGATLNQEGGHSLKELMDEYGDAARLESVLRDRLRLAIRTLILKAWRRRRKLTTHVTHELACFEEDDPQLRDGMLSFRRLGCRPMPCSVAQILQEYPDAIGKVRRTILKQETKRENDRRTSTLKKLTKKPDQGLNNRECRNLGDAVFAILAPPDATILTTNIRDYKPLAECLGKEARTPEEVLSKS